MFERNRRSLDEVSGYQLEDMLAEYARQDAEREGHPRSGSLGNTDPTKRGRGSVVSDIDRGRSENRLEGKL